MAVDLHLQVTRSEDRRFSGTVHALDQSVVRTFSGTLELMRVLEDLVPAGSTGTPAPSPGSAEGPPGETDLRRPT